MYFKNKISRIIGRTLTGASTGKEKQILKKWQQADEANEKGLRIISQLWDKKNLAETSKESSISSDVFFRRAYTHSVNSSANWLKIAASIALIITFTSLLFYNLLYRTGTGNLELVTGYGHRTEAVMPDGTKVWLNNGSELKYNHGFGRVRKVDLSGEAMFSVEKDITSPFVVDLNGLKIRVTGTQFNVRSYPEDQLVEITLVEGSVRLITQTGKKISMEPGEMVSWDRSSDQLLKNLTDPRTQIAWKDGVLVFNRTPFKELITRLQRHYNIEVHFDESAFQDIHYTGTIRNLRADQVFDFISLTIDIDVDMNDNNIVLKRKTNNPHN